MLVLRLRLGSFAYARRVSRAAGSFAGAGRLLRRRLRVDAAAARALRWRLLARRAAHGVA